MVGLGDLAGGTFSSHANGISSDGSVVVGQGSGASGYEAFLWTAGSGMTGLGDLAGGFFYSLANDVSDDGSVVVGAGSSVSSGPYTEAMHWTSSGGMVGLGDFAGGVYSSEATGVSNDGSVVVGWGRNAAGKEAFRWTADDGMVGLGELPGGGVWSTASAVSGDGKVVVGSSGSGKGGEAFRWTAGDGMVGLGIMPGYTQSDAAGVNRDGSVVVGTNENDDDDAFEAFRWSAATGMQSLSDWLADSGHPLVGWSETYALDVSDDGTVIVGTGTSSNGIEAFVARGGSGLIGVTDFTNSLRGVGSATATGISNAQVILHGAHGHPGARRALDEKRTLWVAGDLARDGDDGFALAEIGASYCFTEVLTLGAAFGKTWGNTGLDYSGDIDSRGFYLALDADIRLPVDLPLYATLTYLYGNSDLDIRRGYLNGGGLDASRGDATQTTQAVRARLQWESAARLDKVGIHPYLEYNLTGVKTGGYTETGGGFPVRFDGVRESVHDWRLGVDVNRELDGKTRFLGTLEAVRRVEGSGHAVSGQVIGLLSFDIDGRDYDQDWLRVTVGVERELGDGRLTLSLNATTEGEDPGYWGGVNYSKAF